MGNEGVKVLVIVYILTVTERAHDHTLIFIRLRLVEEMWVMLTENICPVVRIVCSREASNRNRRGKVNKEITVESFALVYATVTARWHQTHLHTAEEEVWLFSSIPHEHDSFGAFVLSKHRTTIIKLVGHESALLRNGNRYVLHHDEHPPQQTASHADALGKVEVGWNDNRRNHAKYVLHKPT